MLRLCFMHRQESGGPQREGLSEVTELEDNSGSCGESPYGMSVQGWGLAYP